MMHCSYQTPNSAEYVHHEGRLLPLFVLEAAKEREREREQLTGLSRAFQLRAESFGVDRHHGDGVFGVWGELRKQDGSFLPSNLGLAGIEYISI